MKLHEYQAKEIFRKWNVPTPEGAVAFSGIEAMQIAKGLKAEKYVVKGQHRGTILK